MMTSNKKMFALIILFLFVSTILSGQDEPVYLQLHENEKLQSNTAKKIFIASDKRIWFVTNNGLISFDGSDIKTFTHKANDSTSLSDNDIYDIAEDKKGNLYVSTSQSGIDYLDLRTGKANHIPITFKEGLKKGYFTIELLRAKLFVDDDGVLWIGLPSRGIYYYNPFNRQYKHINIVNDKPDDIIDAQNNSVFDIKQDKVNKDILWLATSKGILSLNKKTHSVSKFFRGLSQDDSLSPQVKVNKLDVLNDSIIWFCNDLVGLGYYNIKNGVYSFPNKNKRTAIRTFSPKGPVEYYVAPYFESPYIYNTRTSSVLKLQDLFFPEHYREFSDIVQDSFGNLWCILNNSIYVAYTKKKFFTTISSRDIIYQDKTRNIFKNIIWDTNTRKYYAAYDLSDGVFVYDSNMIWEKNIPAPPLITPYGQMEPGATDIIIDAQKKLWLTGPKLLVYDSLTQSMIEARKKYPSLSSLKYWCENALFDDPWIYTQFKNFLYRINSRTQLYDSILLPWTMDSVGEYNMFGKVVLDKKNNFLYSCNFNNRKKETIIFQYNLQTSSFKSLTFTADTKIDPLISNFSWYLPDDFGNLWVANKKGIYCYDALTLKEKFFHLNNNGFRGMVNIKGRGKICILRNTDIEIYDYINRRSDYFTIIDGLLNSMLATAYANNRLFIGHQGYLQFASPDSLMRNNENRVCYLSNIEIPDKNLQLPARPENLKKLDLKYFQNSIILTVSSVEFNQPQRLVYKYKLENLNKDWQQADFTNRVISFNNLKPGKYIFKAIMQNDNGSWSDKEASLIIEIHPAVWQTWWLKLSFSIIALLIIFQLYKRRLSTIKEKEAKRNMHEKELLELEAKALRAQMNPHFIFNCLNSIKSLIQDDKKDKSVTYLTTFSKLIRTLFNNADKKEISLNDEIETCKLYLQLEAMRFDSKFSYHIDIDETIDLKSISVPALIIQPFIENAIWHGIVPKGSGGNVLLSVNRSNGNIEIIVDDDGIGRESSQQNKTVSIGHQSKGVNLTQSRLELDNLLQQRQATLEIVDKKDENGKATGTKVILNFSEEK